MSKPKNPPLLLAYTKVETLLKVAETYCIKAENGEWQIEPGTYKSMKSAVNYVKTEQFKQAARQKRRTLNIDFIADEERRDSIARHNMKEVNVVN
jgi:hypothetical protein